MRLINKYKRYPYASIHRNAVSQQYGIVTNWDICNVTRSSKHFIHRLEKWSVLEGHTGCVNTISWNGSGTLLLSGSDDYMLNIYDVYSQKMIHSIESGHRANIFSAKFLPCTSDMKVVSCSGDGMLHYNELGTNYGENFFNCHSGTTYEVLVTPGDPNSFLSCGEDGTVRLFDLRTKTKCHCQECSEDILIDARHAVTSISINPLSPYHLAAGCKDSYVRVFDRRTLGTAVNTRSVNRNRDWMPGLFCKFKPENLRKDASCRITSLRYSNDGSDILVSYCTDYVYTFSVNDRQGNLFHTKETKADNGYPTGTKNILDDESEGLPPVKRLRLRGDWSDTGPQARPENADENAPESNLMQRMSELFSRWLEEAISSPLDRETSLGSNMSLNTDTVVNNTQNEMVSTSSQHDNNMTTRQHDNSSDNSEDTDNTNISNDHACNTGEASHSNDTGCETTYHEDDSRRETADINVNCPLEMSLDSVDENWMLCSTDTENEQSTNNFNQNNLRENNCSENIACGNDLSHENNMHVNNKNMDGATLPDQHLKPSSLQNEDGPFCYSTTCPKKSEDIDVNTSCTDVVTNSNTGSVETKCKIVLVKKTLWPDDFCKSFSPSDNASRSDTDIGIQHCPCDSIDETTARSSQSMSETKPVLSTNMNTLHNSVSVLDAPNKHKRTKDHVTQCKGVVMGRHDANNVCNLSVDRRHSQTCNMEEETSLNGDDAVGQCSLPNNQVYQDNCNPTHNISVNDRSHVNDIEQQNMQNNTDEGENNESNIIEGKSHQECITTHQSPMVTIQNDDTICTDSESEHTSQQTSAHTVISPSGTNQFDSSITDKMGNPENKSIEENNVVVATTAVSQNSVCNEIGIGSVEGTGDERQSFTMEVSGTESEVDTSRDITMSTSTRNALLLRVMQHSSHSDVELPPRTVDLSSDTQPSSNVNEHESDEAVNDLQESGIDNLAIRERAAYRIQKFLRLNKYRFSSSDDNYDDDAKPVFMPTKYSVFKGHRNARTMIKEANFWGDDYVLSGSDCGRIFIWDRHTGDLVMLLQGDSHVVNCVQPHPFDPMLASSGIDHDVKIWVPLAEQLPDLADMGEIVHRNEQMLEESRDTITVPASFVLRMLASFGGRRRGSYRRVDDEESDDIES